MRKKKKIQECILFLLIYLYNYVSHNINIYEIKKNYYNHIKRSINFINYNNLKFDFSIKTPNLLYRSHDHSQNSIFVENFWMKTTHRSTEIMQRFRMLAVQLSTSKLTQRSHIIAPKDQLPEIS